jgi:hypothetical protein
MPKGPKIGGGGGKRWVFQFWLIIQIHFVWNFCTNIFDLLD